MLAFSESSSFITPLYITLHSSGAKMDPSGTPVFHQDSIEACVIATKYF